MPSSRPGVFMRALLPRPSRSCTGTIAVRAREASASRASSQLGSSSSMPGGARGGERAVARGVGRQLPPGERRVVVVRPRVGDAVLARPSIGSPRPPGAGTAAPTMPGQPELVAQPLDRRRDHAEVLGDQRQLAELAPRPRRRARGPGPRRQLPSSAVSRAARHRPVRDEAAEVVDPRRVDELERAPEALDPPAVAGRAQRAASRRAGCPRAGPSSLQSSGGTPATAPSRNSSGSARWSALPGRDVDRDVAEQRARRARAA